ncbi:MAG: hypothetical protein COA37_17680 [Hoeflea sp.]|uniref:hypothetical protein n=1 Tax=Hoeflea sp. TaxID=1940281 RepID=UPI000C10D7BB|nr:hypothetical protein [Hoeflea sp.]PHR19261.1 MAG: hypothetical protein COA37_17680 [Hoeflea sp.]
MYLAKASGMGVGSNPAFWFVAVTIILIVFRYLLDLKEVPMNTKCIGRKTNQLKTSLRNALVAALETIWVVAANITVGLVALTIH